MQGRRTSAERGASEKEPPLAAQKKHAARSAAPVAVAPLAVQGRVLAPWPPRLQLLEDRGCAPAITARCPTTGLQRGLCARGRGWSIPPWLRRSFIAATARVGARAALWLIRAIERSNCTMAHRARECIKRRARERRQHMFARAMMNAAPRRSLEASLATTTTTATTASRSQGSTRVPTRIRPVDVMGSDILSCLGRTNTHPPLILFLFRYVRLHHRQQRRQTDAVDSTQN